MRWKISRSHDPRHIDLLTAVVLLIAILAAWRFFSGAPEKSNAGASASALIVPSQNVRW
jgi:hypothetical protein